MLPASTQSTKTTSPLLEYAEFRKLNQSSSANVKVARPRHSYFLKLNDRDSWNVITEKDLTRDELESISSYIISEAKRQDSYVRLPDAMTNQLAITELHSLWEPMIAPGLECLTELQSKVQSVESFRRQLSELITTFNCNEQIDDSERYPPEVMLMAMSGCMCMLEESREASRQEIEILKEYIIQLKTVSEGKIPAKIPSLTDMAATLNVSIQTAPVTSTVHASGSPKKVQFLSLFMNFCKHSLEIHELFSKAFGVQLKECLAPLAKNLVEIGAGKGMLSGALAEAGKKVLYTSDLRPPEFTWPSIRVGRNKATTVVNKYGSRFKEVIYLASQCDIGMLESLIRNGKPMFLLQTGNTYEPELAPYKQQLICVNLNLSEYSPRNNLDKVRLLAVNMSRTDAEEMFAKLPDKYRVDK